MQLHAGGVQADGYRFQTLQRAGVDQVDARAHQNQMLGLGMLTDERGDAVLQIAGVGEVEAFIHPYRQHFLALDYGEAFDVAKVLATWQLAYHSDMRLAGPPEE